MNRTGRTTPALTRFLAILLAICMVTADLPAVTAFAQTVDAETEELLDTEEEEAEETADVETDSSEENLQSTEAAETAETDSSESEDPSDEVTEAADDDAEAAEADTTETEEGSSQSDTEEESEEDTPESEEETDSSEEETSEESSSEDILLSYVAVENSYVEIGSTQTIVISFENGDLIESVILYYHLESDDTVYSVTATDQDGGAFSFEIAYTSDSEIGVYVLDTVAYTVDGETYELVFSEIGIDAQYGVEATADTEPDAVVTDEEDEDESEAEISIATLDEDGELVYETSVEAALASVEASTTNDTVVVVLDPGHDSTHVGASANGLNEYELNLKIAEYCKAELEEYYGVTVYMTRESDDCPYPGTTSSECNASRVQYAASVGADVYISLHLNASATSSSSDNGVEVYYPNSNYNSEIGEEGSELAEAVLEELVALGLTSRGTKIRNSEDNTLYDDGSLADYYAVIRRSKLAGFPAIIIEHAFLTNSSDAAFLKSESNLKALGVADATGIANYFGLSKDDEEINETRYVTLDCVNLYLTPSTSADYITVSYGTEVVLCGRYASGSNFFVVTYNNTDYYLYLDTDTYSSISEVLVTSTNQLTVVGYGNTSAKVSLYEEASTSSSRIQYVLKGALVCVLVECADDSWYYVELSDGTRGYMRASYVTFTSDDTFVLGLGVLTSNANLRKRATTSASRVGYLYEGTVLTVVEVSSLNSAWYYVVLADGTVGYVSKKFVELTDSLTRYVAEPTLTLYCQPASGSSITVSYGDEVEYKGRYSSGSDYYIVAYEGTDYYLYLDTDTYDTIDEVLAEEVSIIGDGILTGSVNLRKTASWSGTVIQSVSKRTVVSVLVASGNWYYVELGDGTQGYLPASYIDFTTVLGLGTTTSSLNLRKSASTSGKLIQTLAKGTALTVIETASSASDWYYVELSDGTRGYVSASYVDLVDSVTRYAAQINLKLYLQPAKGDYITVDYGTELEYQGLYFADSNYYRVVYDDSVYYVYLDTSLYSSIDERLSEEIDVIGAGILTASASLRETASTSGTLIQKVKKNVVVTVLARSSGGSWYYVKLADGTTGYILAKYVDVSFSACLGSVNFGFNLRESNSSSSTFIQKVKRGTVLTVLAKSSGGNWYYVELADGTTGFGYAQYIDLVDSETRYTVTANQKLYCQAAKGDYITVEYGTALEYQGKYAYGSDYYSVAYNGTDYYVYLDTDSDSSIDDLLSDELTVIGTGTVSKSVNMRDSASTSGTILQKLSAGTELTVLAKSSGGSWYYVELSDGTRGYVSSSYVTIS